MEFVTDVHLHSRYARATSRELNPENLHLWSALKGIDVVGTGDYTHPDWLAELREKLEPAEEGLFRLGAEWRDPVEKSLPLSCFREVRFILSVEISSIYKKNGQTRKVHNLVIMPDFDSVEELNRRLGAIGNLGSDGRPILGLDSRDLLEICLEACPQVLFIPAHIWTPHFAVLGASSGFDSLEECYEDLLPHIFAVETGLSSDPPMNWRLSLLDDFAIVSNSDAHSPQKLAREATCFDTELSYPGIYQALKERDPTQFIGTLEFYPEEGKYHYDGHRKCQVCWKPAQTLAAEGICPECGRKLTVGVLHRVEKLADRPEGVRPVERPDFEYIIPLKEIIGSVLAVGPNTKKVAAVYDKLLAELGPELRVLRRVEPETIAGLGEPLVAEGVRRMRTGEVEISPGYDGEFGLIRVFSDAEREQLKGQTALFEMPTIEKEPAPESLEEKGTNSEVNEKSEVKDIPKRELDEVQRQAVEAMSGPVVVIAGPGSGKTRALTYRIAHLVREQGVDPGQILAVTFTNRAAGEMQTRLEELLAEVNGLGRLRVGTFHRIALELLRECGAEEKTVLDELEARRVLGEVLGENRLALRPAQALEAISLAKSAGLNADDLEEVERTAYRAYQERLAAYRARDYDDILLDLLLLLEGNAEELDRVRRQFPHLLIDEFQDVNAVQYRLVTLLADRGRGLFAIGDPDQAIYGFRGAEPRFFGALRRNFSGVRLFHLETNYRSRGNIVRAAAGVIGHNEGREEMQLRAVQEAGPPVRLLSVPGETAEGIAVVREIGRMVGGADMVQADQGADGERSFGDFAVLYRTGRQAGVLEECFLKEGLPYRLVGQRGFLEAESVRQALAFCRYALRPEKGLRLLHALELEMFGAGERVLKEVRKRIVDGAGMDGLSAAAAESLGKLEQAAAKFRDLRPEAFFQKWTEESGAEDEDLEHLIQVAAAAESLEELLDTLLLGREADYERAGDGTARGEAVTLMTLHAAKGLEFPVVFICGVEDGLIPFREREADLQEERRLFYVGLTRAREEVVLLRTRSRLRYGERLQPGVSPFAWEIPGDLLIEERVEPPRKREDAEQMSLF
jgi:uncharacterized protein (TIGR00375 family)